MLWKCVWLALEAVVFNWIARVLPRLASLTGGSFDILLAMICSCIKLLRKYQNAFNKSELRFSCCIILFYRKERWSSSYKPSYLSCGWCCWAWGWGLHWCWGRLVRSKYLLSCLCWLCYIHATNEKPCFPLFLFVNQVLGFRVKALKSSLPLPPSPPPLTTFISSAYYLTCAFQYYKCLSGLSMLPENIK